MIPVELVTLQQVGTRQELLDALVRFANELGFRTTNAIAVVDHPDRESEFFYVTNTPPEANGLDDREFNRIDPVMQHCRRFGTPIPWDQNTYTAVGYGERWEEQALYGFHSGIAFAMHLPAGRHFFVSVDRDVGLPSDVGELMRMTAQLQLFAAYAHEAAQRVLVLSNDMMKPAGLLTARELECLQWTMEGKTAWEVGAILSISEQTAARHLHHAARKLDCMNKHHAVVKALRLGLIR